MAKHSGKLNQVKKVVTKKTEGKLNELNNNLGDWDFFGSDEEVKSGASGQRDSAFDKGFDADLNDYNQASNEKQDGFDDPMAGHFASKDEEEPVVLQDEETEEGGTRIKGAAILGAAATAFFKSNTSQAATGATFDKEVDKPGGGDGSTPGGGDGSTPGGGDGSTPGGGDGSTPGGGDGSTPGGGDGSTPGGGDGSTPGGGDGSTPGGGDGSTPGGGDGSTPGGGDGSTPGGGDGSTPGGGDGSTPGGGDGSTPGGGDGSTPGGGDGSTPGGGDGSTPGGGDGSTPGGGDGSTPGGGDGSTPGGGDGSTPGGGDGSTPGGGDGSTPGGGDGSTPGGGDGSTPGGGDGSTPGGGDGSTPGGGDGSTPGGGDGSTPGGDYNENAIRTDRIYFTTHFPRGEVRLISADKFKGVVLPDGNKVPVEFNYSWNLLKKEHDVLKMVFQAREALIEQKKKLKESMGTFTSSFQLPDNKELRNSLLLSNYVTPKNIWVFSKEENKLKLMGVDVLGTLLGEKNKLTFKVDQAPWFKAYLKDTALYQIKEDLLKMGDDYDYQEPDYSKEKKEIAEKFIKTSDLLVDKIPLEDSSSAFIAALLNLCQLCASIHDPSLLKNVEKLFDLMEQINQLVDGKIIYLSLSGESDDDDASEKTDESDIFDEEEKESESDIVSDKEDEADESDEDDEEALEPLRYTNEITLDVLYAWFLDEANAAISSVLYKREIDKMEEAGSVDKLIEMEGEDSLWLKAFPAPEDSDDEEKDTITKEEQEKKEKLEKDKAKHFKAVLSQYKAGLKEFEKIAPLYLYVFRIVFKDNHLNDEVRRILQEASTIIRAIDQHDNMKEEAKVDVFVYKNIVDQLFSIFIYYGEFKQLDALKLNDFVEVHESFLEIEAIFEEIAKKDRPIYSRLIKWIGLLSNGALEVLHFLMLENKIKEWQEDTKDAKEKIETEAESQNLDISDAINLNIDPFLKMTDASPIEDQEGASYLKMDIFSDGLFTVNATEDLYIEMKPFGSYDAIYGNPSDYDAKPSLLDKTEEDALDVETMFKPLKEFIDRLIEKEQKNDDIPLEEQYSPEYLKLATDKRSIGLIQAVAYRIKISLLKKYLIEEAEDLAENADPLFDLFSADQLSRYLIDNKEAVAVDKDGSPFSEADIQYKELESDAASHGMTNYRNKQSKSNQNDK